MSAFFRIACLFVLINASALSHAQSSDSTSIVVFGDSIIAGYGLQRNESVPEQLEAMLQEDYPQLNVINGGVSGDTTSAGRSRLAWTLDEYQPDLVILALGGNDVLRGISPAITRDNVNAMLKTLKERNINTVLSAVDAPINLGPQYRKEFNGLYKDLAAEYNIALIPFLLANTYGNNALMQSDGIHPNAAGAKQIANELVDVVEDALKL